MIMTMITTTFEPAIAIFTHDIQMALICKYTLIAEISATCPAIRAFDTNALKLPRNAY